MWQTYSGAIGLYGPCGNGDGSNQRIMLAMAAMYIANGCDIYIYIYIYTRVDLSIYIDRRQLAKT